MMYHLEFYSTDELKAILVRSANLLQLKSTDDALSLIAARSRGTPRIANRLLKRVRDYAQVKGTGKLSIDIVESALKMEQIDALGLDELDRSFLRALVTVYDGGPAGIEAIAATLGEERDTLEDVVEPYLLQIGFVRRTKRGRESQKPPANISASNITKSTTTKKPKKTQACLSEPYPDSLHRDYGTAVRAPCNVENFD